MRKLIGLVVVAVVAVGMIPDDASSRMVCYQVSIYSPKDGATITLDESGGFKSGGFYAPNKYCVKLQMWNSNTKAKVWDQYAIQDENSEPPIWFSDPTGLVPGTYTMTATLLDGVGGEPVDYHQIFDVELVAPNCGNKKAKRGE